MALQPSLSPTLIYGDSTAPHTLYVRSVAFRIRSFDLPLVAANSSGTMSARTPESLQSASRTL